MSRAIDFTRSFLLYTYHYMHDQILTSRSAPSKNLTTREEFPPCAENDARNENFIKQLLSEILTFLIGIVWHWLRKVRISRSQQKPKFT